MIDRTVYYYSSYAKKWRDTSHKLQLDMNKLTKEEKIKLEKDFDKLLHKLERLIDKAPWEDKNNNQWRGKLRSYIKSYMEKDSFFKLKNFDDALQESFLNSTEAFIEETRLFDPELKAEDIGQAIRNLWIFNILQATMDEEVKLNKAILGYSLLYPYTDNYLDDVTIAKDQKEQFNSRLQRRLQGKKLEPLNEHEAKVYSLVKYIEDTFSREAYKEVYEALCGINKGQIMSLNQQRKGDELSQDELLKISIEKGGASVLADGYLIKGSLSPEEMEFCIGYGFMLQLGDDLQDLKEDINNNHSTLMSMQAGKMPLDSLATRLINLTIDLVDNYNCKNKSSAEKLKELIKTNCLMLIFFSVVFSKEYFTEEYILTMSEYLPFTLEYTEGIKGKLQKSFGKFKNWNYMQKT